MWKSRRAAHARRAITLTRREFLKAGTTGSGLLLLADPTVAGDIGAELPTFRFQVRRDSDLLSLYFRFVNFDRRGDMLHALGSGRSA